MTRFAIAIGSNLGDRLSHLHAAVEGIKALGNVTAVASLYETAPVGGPDQEDFLNSVLVLETDLTGPDLLTALQDIESSRSRERTMRWGPRTLDLDIVGTSGEPIESPPDLTVPHPRASQRRFVLAPLVEVWPEVTVGPGGLTAAEAEANVLDQEIHLISVDW